MPIKYTTKWNRKDIDEIIDVRTKAEYEEDHIPCAINLPVLLQKERDIVGKIYKKENGFNAKKLGASFISKNISKIIKKKFYNKPGSWKPLIYCWRGGQRSKSIAIVLSEIGWQVRVLKGGYKTYRASINNELNKITKNSKFMVLKGPTGCAKTKILKKLNSIGVSSIDLEGIALHKGSLLGNIPKFNQPSQKLFESRLYFQLKSIKNRKLIFIESESSKIGNLYLPQILLNKIKNSPAIEISADLNARIMYLINDYKNYLVQDNSFIKLFKYADSKIGKQKVDKWRNYYKKKDWYNLAYYLITEYYDPLYAHNLKNKKNKLVKKTHFLKLNNQEINTFCLFLKKKF